MSELINNSEKRKELLKHVILQIHEGKAPEELNKQLHNLLSKIPYGEVVEVEQQLINEGLPEQEVLKLCDAHTRALQGVISLEGMKTTSPGHPVDTFIKENKELLKVIDELEKKYEKVENLPQGEIKDEMLKMKGLFNQLSDVDKHYQRKEYLLFPFLEQNNITGPPTVMWGKHDEIRARLEAAREALSAEGEVTPEELKIVVDMVLKPASDGIADMIMKEEEILFPMSLDKLTDVEWYEIYKQTLEYGFCLYDPKDEWKPEGLEKEEAKTKDGDIQLPSGSMSNQELLAILNTVPFDMTFVDKNDKVKYFTQGAERIFSRSRAILNRDVRMCHPPSSVNIVDQIVEDFKSGKQSRAPFWIQLHGKFIHIEYFALRDEQGNYLGTLEVSQELTEKRALTGEQRLLSYAENNGVENNNGGNE